MFEDLTYSKLHEMMMKKFNLEANYRLNLSVKLSSFDYTFDIIDDAEVQFFVDNACSSIDQLAHLHPAIALAVYNKFPLAFHVVCCRHLMINLSLKRKKTKGLFWKICKAYTPEDFASNMSILQVVQPDAYHKLCEAGPHRWPRAHCLLVRCNYMTSNSTESVNACTVPNRKLLVLKLAETYRAMVQDWYYKRRELAGISL
ncbi:hypothetical protein Tco_0611387 [Tanacetum coccineum]